MGEFGGLSLAETPRRESEAAGAENQKEWRGCMMEGLYQGDCLEVMKQFPDSHFDACITDPPYGTTACKWDTVIPLEPMWSQLHRIVKPNGAIVLFGNEPFASKLRMSNINNYRYDLIWDKIKGTGFLNAKKMPMRNHENIILFYIKPPAYNPQMTTGHKRKISYRSKHHQTEVYGEMKNDYTYNSTNRYPRSIIAISTDTQNSSIHPTQKPVALMKYLIQTYTNAGEIVVDFTMGSGSTGVACAQLGRRFVGIELDPDYFAIAQKRIAAAYAQPRLFGD
jgi:site-specific DNA-methyltransferase (adenine-specific)